MRKTLWKTWTLKSSIFNGNLREACSHFQSLVLNVNDIQAHRTTYECVCVCICKKHRWHVDKESELSGESCAHRCLPGICTHPALKIHTLLEKRLERTWGATYHIWGEGQGGSCGKQGDQSDQFSSKRRRQVSVQSRGDLPPAWWGIHTNTPSLILKNKPP